MQEIWKDIEWYEGLYEVSSFESTRVLENWKCFSIMWKDNEGYMKYIWCKRIWDWKILLLSSIGMIYW